MANVASPPRRTPTKPRRPGAGPAFRRLPRTFKARLGTIVGAALLIRILYVALDVAGDRG